MDQNQMGQSQMAKMCPCPHHKMVPAFITLIGLSFLLTALGVITSHVNEIIWPILVILLGLQKIFASKCTCCAR